MGPPENDAKSVNRVRTPIDTSEPSPIVVDYRAGMKRHIIGQDRAVSLLEDSVEIDEARMHKTGDLALQALFAGPPGVGKTETAKAHGRVWIGDIFRDSEDRPIEPITKVDCTMYVDRYDVANLVGSAKGYVGYEEPTPLAQERMDDYGMEVLFSELAAHFLELKAQKYSPKTLRLTAAERARIWRDVFENAPFKKVLLFDEVERAHRSLWNILITIMNALPFEFSDGSVSTFERAALILSTNTGEKKIQQLMKGGIGFHGDNWAEVDPDKLHEALYKITLKEIQDIFPSPLVSRLRRNIVVFRALTDAEYASILDLRLNEIDARYEQRYGKALPGTKLIFTPEARALMLKKGIDRRYGARPLEQTLNKHLLTRLARLLNRNKRKAGDPVLRPGDALVFDTEHDKIVTYIER